MIYALFTIHIVVSVFLILVVLLQQGKGADLSVFGGGSTQAAFGARGAATLLHKLTVGGFVIFTLTTLSISLMQGRATHGSVMDTGAAKPPASAPATTPPAPEGTSSTAPVGGTTAPAPADSAPATEAPASGAPATPAPPGT